MKSVHEKRTFETQALRLHCTMNNDLVTLFINVKNFTKLHGVTNPIEPDTYICPVCSFNFEFALMSRQLDSKYLEYFATHCNSE